VIRAIRSAVVEEHEIDPHAIVLLRPGALPLTSSGKVQRNLCRELFASGQLEELTRWEQQGDIRSAQDEAEGSAQPADTAPSRPEFLDRLASLTPAALAGEIQEWMLDWLATRVEVGPADLTPTAAFSELGMDSLTALELNVEFENVLGVRLPSAAAWSYPTPTALSMYLAERLLGIAPADDPVAVEPTDSWFAAMEADARRP
jgi:acyl carrier protein